MFLVRWHLRRGVAAWLVCHALTFTALVPRDCCAAHAHAASAGHETPSAGHDAPPCHDSAEAPAAAAAPAPGAHCEMAAADGAACPVHQPGAATAPAECAMRSSCHAPESALATVVMQAAVLVHAGLPVPAAPIQIAARAPDVSARSLAVPPDAPPPRL